MIIKYIGYRARLPTFHSNRQNKDVHISIHLFSITLSGPSLIEFCNIYGGDSRLCAGFPEAPQVWLGPEDAASKILTGSGQNYQPIKLPKYTSLLRCMEIRARVQQLVSHEDLLLSMNWYEIHDPILIKRKDSRMEEMDRNDTLLL